MNLAEAADVKFGGANISAAYFGNKKIWDRFGGGNVLVPEGWSLLAESPKFNNLGGLEFARYFQFSGNGEVIAALDQATNTVIVYQISEGELIQIGNPIPFLVLIDMDVNYAGDIVILGGGFNADDSRGEVAVFKWNGSTWQKLGQSIFGSSVAAQAGTSVSINNAGDVIVFNEFNGSTAKARAYDFINNLWVSRQEITYPYYPFMVVQLNATGDILACSIEQGPSQDSLESGFVRVYEWNGSAWSQRGNTIPGYQGVGSNETSWDGVNAPGSEYFGSSLSMNPAGDIIAVGAPRNGAEGVYFTPPNFINWVAAGQVRVYQFTNGDWQQLGQDIVAPNSREKNPDGSLKHYRFGRAVQIDSGQNVFVTYVLDNIIEVPAIVSTLYNFDGLNWSAVSEPWSHGLRGSVELSSNFYRAAQGYQNQLRVFVSE